MLHADLVFGSPQAIQRFQHRLPAEVEVTGGPLPELPSWEATRRALAAAKIIDPTDEPVDWAGEVAWRLVRSYELRQNHDERDKVRAGRSMGSFPKRCRRRARRA
ncbi:MAG: hypothetical protein IPI35_29890 [Deltaproteobacteria bacterium]|nr:hypothetical protein [Deltaproteobacteria bacterium]